MSGSTIGKFEVLSGFEEARQATNGDAGVNLDQVQAALLTHPSVVDCAVLPRKNETSDLQLVAYVVSAGPFEGKGVRLE